MFSLVINGILVLFSKFFNLASQEEVLQALGAESPKKVLFVDTAATPNLAATIRSLSDKGIEVVVRDHHRGEGRTPEAAEEIETILGENARIVTRDQAPGCAQLVELGEFSKEGTVIIADPDLDGILAAMKAAGVKYEGMDEDAEIFDVRPKQSAETLTGLGWTVCRALSTLPPFNASRPEVALQAKAELFQSFVLAAQGDEEARQGLEAKVATYEAAVDEAKRLLAEKMSHPCEGVVMVDSVGANRPDLSTLSKGMEANGAVVTVVRKDFGPIAGKPGGHGVQYSLAVVRKHQAELDLRDLVPEGMETGPVAGLISNTSFLLHCSEGIWNETILPALKERLA